MIDSDDRTDIRIDGNSPAGDVKNIQRNTDDRIQTIRTAKCKKTLMGGTRLTKFTNLYLQHGRHTDGTIFDVEIFLHTIEVAIHTSQTSVGIFTVFDVIPPELHCHVINGDCWFGWFTLLHFMKQIDILSD